VADPFNLDRFVEAQDPVYDQVLAELSAGAKRSHWMWFIFPQIRGLGSSSTAQFYAIASLDEARAYWRHIVLGPRLLECTKRVLGVNGRTAEQIFGSIDAMKFRSSMTLFERAAPEERAFGEAIDRYYSGERDAKTIAMLEGAA
jgi:uncharacterized protein (DUF1810 family)